MSRIRYRIDTVFGQLAERYHAKRIWARDTWHLCSRLLSKILSHTIAMFLNIHAATRRSNSSGWSPKGATPHIGLTN